MRKWISSTFGRFHPALRDFILRSRISLSVLRRENGDAYRLRLLARSPAKPQPPISANAEMDFIRRSATAF